MQEYDNARKPTPVLYFIKSRKIKFVKTILTLRTFGIFLSLLLFCSHSPADSIVPQLPADSTMNKNAGRGNFLFVMLRLENGGELPFMVDTGSPITVFDESLEPKLGKCLKRGTVTMGGVKQKSGRYAAPKLYLGSAPLMTGSNIYTYDIRQKERHSTYMGILGMDCLEHYCIQLNFEAEKIHFLDSDHLNTAELGKAFPLTFKGGHIYIHHAGLLGGTNTDSLVDTGWNIDAQVEKGALKGHDSGWVRLPKCVWDNETYTNLNVEVSQNANMLGLKFLARHLVTFDFPKRTMYLKKGIDPLVNENTKAVVDGSNGHIIKECPGR